MPLSHGPDPLLQTEASEKRPLTNGNSVCGVWTPERQRQNWKNKTSNEKSVCFTTPPPPLRKGPAVNWEFMPFISGNTMHITLTYNNWDGYKVAVFIPSQICDL